MGTMGTLIHAIFDNTFQYERLSLGNTGAFMHYLATIFATCLNLHFYSSDDATLLLFIYFSNKIWN